MELIEVKKDDIYCNSSLVAKVFGVKHENVVKKILKLESDLLEVHIDESIRVCKTLKENKIYRGKSYTVHFMNREFYSLLITRFRGKRAFLAQVRFNDSFLDMEDKLAIELDGKSDREWINIDKSLSGLQKLGDSIVDEFLDYARSQGCNKADIYRSKIWGARYKALGIMAQKKPKLRDQMGIYQVSELLLAERVAKNAIKKYMGVGRNYQDIYESVKDDLIVFANSMKLTVQ